MSARQKRLPGKLVVAVIVTAAISLAAAAVWVRRNARLRHVSDLRTGEAARPRAFNGLLGASPLRGLGRKYVYLPLRPGDAEESLHYAEGFDRDGNLLIGIAGFDMDRSGAHAELLDGGAVFVIDAQGDFVHVAPGARLQRVGSGKEARILVWCTDPPGSARVRVDLVDPRPRVAFRFRGVVRLKTDEAAALVGGLDRPLAERRAAGEAIPAVRYRAADECFASPASDPAVPFELDRAGSPLLCPP